jgi:hypothetical protein
MPEAEPMGLAGIFASYVQVEMVSERFWIQ